MLGGHCDNYELGPTLVWTFGAPVDAAADRVRVVAGGLWENSHDIEKIAADQARSKHWERQGGGRRRVSRRGGGGARGLRPAQWRSRCLGARV